MSDFDFPSAVRDATGFFGREDEFNSVVLYLTSKSSQPVVIQGERRIGKTSLLNRVVQHLSNLGTPNFVPIFIEPRGIKTASELFKYIVSKNRYFNFC